MTMEPHEAGWRELAGLAAGDAEPSELTDRRILKEAGRIAAEQRAFIARAQTRRRWTSGALAASLALVAIGVGYGLAPGRFGASGPDAGGDMLVPADAGRGATAPAMSDVEVPLEFAPDGVSLQPTDQDQLAAAVSQIDPCAAGVSLQLVLPVRDAKSDMRAEAVAAALRAVSGERCKVRVASAVGGHDLAGAAAVLVITHTPTP